MSDQGSRGFREWCWQEENKRLNAKLGPDIAAEMRAAAESEARHWNNGTDKEPYKDPF